MITKHQYGFEKIKISDKLDEVVKAAIEMAKKKKKKEEEEKKKNLIELNESTTFVATAE